MDKITEILKSEKGVLLAAALVGAVLFGGILFLWLRSFLFRSLAAARARRGRRLEGRAGKILARNGFEVLGEQVPAEIRLRVDGRKVSTTVRADFIARKRGRLYAADSKSGAASENPARADVRRQLLEYCLAFGCDRALMVDMENKTIREVEFGFPLHGGGGIGPGAVFACSLLAGLAGLVAGAVFF